MSTIEEKFLHTVDFTHKYSSSAVIDWSEDVVATPDPKHLKLGLSQEELLNRLNQLESPTDRLITLAKSCFDGQPTHEAAWLRQIAVGSLLGGGLFGAILKSQGVHAEYARKHNASVFENKFHGNRHFWDTLVAGLLPRGLGYAVKTCLFSTSASFIVIGSIVYRGKLYPPDWFLGLGAVGAMSRLWLGPRAMAVGGLCGGAAAIAGLAAVKAFELVTRTSVTQMRLLNHSEWLGNREAKRRQFLALSQESYEQFAGDDSLRFDIDG